MPKAEVGVSGCFGGAGSAPGAIGSALGAEGGGSSSPDDSLESMRFVKVLGKSLQRMRFPFDTTEEE